MFLDLLAVALIVLKITGYLNLRWPLILMPVYIIAGISWNRFLRSIKEKK